MNIKPELERFEKHLAQAGYMAQSVKGYVGTLERLNVATGGLLGSPSVVQARLQRWRTRQQDALENRHRVAATVRANITALRTFYTVMSKLAIWHGDNPAKDLAYPRRRMQEYLPRPAPREQIHRLLASFDECNASQLKAKVIVELFLHGLRRTEVARLRWAHVQPAGDTVTLLVQGKGGFERQVPIRSDTVLRLAQIFGHVTLDGLATEAQSRCAKGKGAEQLFIKDNGRAFSLRDLNRLFVVYRVKAGLPTSVGPHSLRHTCGTELLRAGSNLREVQEILGHRDIRTTTLYTQVSSDERRAAVNALPY